MAGGWGSLSFGRSHTDSQSSSSSEQSVFLANAFSRLFAGAGGAAGDIDVSGLTNTANELFKSGSGFIDSLMNVGSGEALQSNIDALGTDISSFFNEELLPGITSDAASVGGLGGSRQGVAQGIAAGKMTDAYASGVAGLRSADVQQRIGASVAGMDALGQQFGLAQEAAFAPLSPYLALAQIMGDPTILTQAQSQSSSSGGSFNFATAGGGGMGMGG